MLNVIMLSVCMLSIVMLSVGMLSFGMLNVVAPPSSTLTPCYDTRACTIKLMVVTEFGVL
jgi:hypothetical protein